MRIPSPSNGLVEGLASGDQQTGTFFSGQNVRPYDVTKEKIRVGQRGGTALAYTTQIVGDFPVIDITEIVTTYITPGS